MWAQTRSASCGNTVVPHGLPSRIGPSPVNTRPKLGQSWPEHGHFLGELGRILTDAARNRQLVWGLYSAGSRPADFDQARKLASILPRSTHDVLDRLQRRMIALAMRVPRMPDERRPRRR